jgi:hypothetical protein
MHQAPVPLQWQIVASLRRPKIMWLERHRTQMQNQTHIACQYLVHVMGNPWVTQPLPVPVPALTGMGTVQSGYGYWRVMRV